MVESISSGIEELRSQQAQTGEATLRLVAAVSEVEEGTWEESPGLPTLPEATHNRPSNQFRRYKAQKSPHNEALPSARKRPKEHLSHPP